MPRSGVYRSFLTCDDPRGVVECKRIRKSKTGFPVIEDNKVVKQTSKKECGDELNINASCSAQKLTRAIDSFSKGIGLERKSKDVARGLLRGALDLHESLDVLEKLRGKLNNQKERNGKGEFFDGAGVGRTKSERVFGDRNYALELEKPRHSLDGASWDCYDELREVIKDSFTRQNLLATANVVNNDVFESREMDFSSDLLSTSSSQSSSEKAFFGRRRLLSSPDLPSTSSSQSSVFQPYEFSCYESSLPKTRNLKPKAPNLIAKLMGLEDVPLEQFTPHKHLEKEFEIGLPKVKKSVQSPFVNPKQSTLGEIMQFEGLLSKHRDHRPNVLDSENRDSQSRSEIVLMKPIYGNEVDLEERPKKWDRKELMPEYLAVKRDSRSERSKATKSMHEGGCNVKPKCEKKVVVEKRVDKIHKVSTNSRKEEAKNVKFSKSAKPHSDLEKIASVKLKKQEIVSNVSQKHIARPKCKASDVSSHNLRSKKHARKPEKQIKDSSVAIVENPRNNEAQRDNEPTKETDKMRNEAEASENLHLEEISDDASQTLITDDHHSSAKNLSQPYDELCIGLESNPKTNSTKNLLLTSESFLSRAEELFDTHSWPRPLSKPDRSHDEMPETKLLLDCASELLENKAMAKKHYISRDKLVEEICNGIEYLRSYSDLTVTRSADTLSALIERDLGSNGAWGFGWGKGFTCDELEVVVGDMEKLILDAILEDFEL